MFCKYLTLHILTISVINCLFLQCGAEVDAKYNYDDWKPHFFTPRPPRWKQFTVPPHLTGNFDGSPNIIIIVVVIFIFMVIAIIGTILYHQNCCTVEEETTSSLSTTIVHPPPRSETSRLASSSQRNNNRGFTSPRSSSNSFILSPEETQHVITFATVHENPDPPPRTNSMDDPPDYASVVTSDLTNSTAIKYPVVKLEPVVDSSPPPKYDDYKSLE
ncbi:uncharacterized protein LOC129231753 isoform X2 [Uloborus diversus]|uniref:uncharacterized protein LOC129231753 isoform X2 n=1 Tax=Uloborus diversus TaxID=327109 RepID=UPI002409D4B5|nr:uncharacterized protein LOC129231753 isoform X2 [Uloborus diversus]